MFLIPVASFAVSVTGDFRCAAGTELTSHTFTSAPDSTSCDLTSNGYTISGSASVSLTELSLKANQPASQTPFYFAGAEGQIQERYTITADAPSQAGYIVISGEVYNSVAGIFPYSSDGWAYAQILGPNFLQGFDSRGLNSGTYIIPVTLGDTLSVGLLVQMSTDAATDYSFAQLSYQFYTANGTKVGAIIDEGVAPEPSSLALLGTALAGGLFWFRKGK